MTDISALIEQWKNHLLDLGKQNRLLHYRDTKRGSLRIVSPDFDEIYKLLVGEKRVLTFSRTENKMTIQSNRTENEEKLIIKALKDKAGLIEEEQGLHTLFLAMGFLNWMDEETEARSPLVLVPVTFKQDELNSPYEMYYQADEILLNPTLSYKLMKDCGITLPEFRQGSMTVGDYLTQIEGYVEERGWSIDRECSISLFTYAKMKLYEDIEKHKEEIMAHPVLRAFAKDTSALPKFEKELLDYNHDTLSMPSETFQVLDADASQQDAILYSNKNISFVLQGPPGTGKSQTITNIITEALARDKKVLFVSEKMAALEVVYKRLSEAGLGQFCLPLHSYKTEKKEVLEELNQTLHMEKEKTYKDTLYQLDLLKEERKQLNQYASDLHTICEPLHQSIYEVNGHLAKLYMRPNMEFSIDGIEEITSDRLHQMLYLVSEYEKVLDKFDVPLKEHPWFDSCIHEGGHDTKKEIEAKAEQLRDKLSTVSETMEAIMQEYGVKVPKTLLGAYDLLGLLKAAKKAPKDVAFLVNIKNTEDALAHAKNEESKQEEYKVIKYSLDKIFAVQYENVDAEEGITLVTETMDRLRELLNKKHFKTNNDVMLSMTSLLNVLVQEKQLVKEAIENYGVVSERLGLEAPCTVTTMQQIVQLLDLLALNPMPTLQWFDLSKWKSNFNKMQEVEEILSVVASMESDILGEFVEDILTINAEEMLYRFEYEYVGITKHLKKDYRKDMEAVRSLRRYAEHRLEEEDVVEVLQRVHTYQENYKFALERKDWLKRFLGVHYREEGIDWKLVERNLNDFRRILEVFPDGMMPQKIKDLLLAGNGADQALKGANLVLTQMIAPSHVEKLESIFALTESIEETLVEEIFARMNETISKLSLLKQIYGIFYIPKDTLLPYNEGLGALKKLRRYNIITEEFKEQKAILTKLFGSQFEGLSTNWNKIIKGLTFIQDMKEEKENIFVSERYIKSCMEEACVDGLTDTYEYLGYLVNDMEPLVEWFDQLFRYSLANKKVTDLTVQLDNILHNEHSIDQWCAYVRARNTLVDTGLGNFVSEIETMEVESNAIKDTFLKRFYQLWLDKMVPQFDTVANFQGDMLEETRSEFDKLDVKQLEIAKLRVREHLLSNVPDADTSFGADDEIGILKRELASKQRMPLRKLFEQIPNLLLSLKPCFMMSPLTVSLFLETSKFHFDLVIFDEASQVRTEDAIGAILRGSQVIVAGDIKQLPPTSFFMASKEPMMDGAAEIPMCESILEEAQMVLPERTLRWHYRSRNEGLIAFSNDAIYNHNLITFPSSVVNQKDSGVEYYYVEDGVYDRGGKKNNVVEAKRIVELVLEHAKNQPERSLGVITFSDAQRQEIERRILEVRQETSEYEEFFSDKKAEPFFVKNLENVQGDERDTIIFSIAYGKDGQGVFNMNFGPLSKKDGYRRLNVAITRAKYNVKLVGSIMPDDMNLENCNSEGVKMLHDYIVYAINGNKPLRGEEKTALAPFEDSIYEYLVAHNYTVERKVGCSGYRMDLAVVHPNKPGHYVLGIECDGETYFAARTVRERERLRQTVLEEMGWKLYRIWSTDFIKNPFVEGQKLLEAVEQAIAEQETV